MAEFITHKLNIPLAGITGYGARLRAIVEELLYNSDGLSIYNTQADDADNFSVDLSWNDITDWYIRVYNSNANVYFAYMTLNEEGEYEATTSGYQSVLSSDSANLEVNQYDYDFFLAALFSGSSSVSFTILRVVDQFTGDERFAVGATSGYSNYYDFGYLYITDGTYTVRVSMDKNANGLTYHNIAAAIPVVFYTENSNLPMSGMVANGELLYYIYTDTDIKYFEPRFTKFTLGGSEFTSLTRTLCLKTM